MLRLGGMLPAGGDVERERLVAEGFSSSVARALEATDLDDVRVLAPSGPFSLRMRNEALETHAVRSLRLHAVPERRGERVLATPTGEFRLARQVLAPLRCSGPEGDCLAAVRALDGVERRSLTDPDNLARREYLELEFPAPAVEEGAAPRYGLALAARHSFVSTFLFYQMLAYLGRDAAPLLAGLERGDRDTLERIRELKAIPGRLEIAWMDADGAWQPPVPTWKPDRWPPTCNSWNSPRSPPEGPSGFASTWPRASGAWNTWRWWSWARTRFR
jgi:hypothetical protein